MRRRPASGEPLSDLFIEGGLLIKNSGAKPEVSSVGQFIASRQATVDAGELTRFYEAEISARTDVFGNVAHRFIAYAKSGTLNGVSFEVRGMISAQFILTSTGWKMSAIVKPRNACITTNPAITAYHGSRYRSGSTST